MNERVFYVSSLTDYEDGDLAGIKSEGWYFWDESDAWAYGPYKTEEASVDHCGRYYDAITWMQDSEADFYEV